MPADKHDGTPPAYQFPPGEFGRRNGYPVFLTTEDLENERKKNVKKNIIKRIRDAVTGRFTTKAEAARRPNETVEESSEWNRRDANPFAIEIENRDGSKRSIVIGLSVHDEAMMMRTVVHGKIVTIGGVRFEREA